MSQDNSDSHSPPRKRIKLSNKPLIERRRRERINRSLTEIKELVLKENGADEINSSKMEKADILEMTVKHLKEKGASSTLTSQTSTSDVLDRYRAGYMACLQTTLDHLDKHSDLPKDFQMSLAQTISCRMLQFKKCEIIPINRPPDVAIDRDIQTSSLVDNDNTFCSSSFHSDVKRYRGEISPVVGTNSSPAPLYSDWQRRPSSTGSWSYDGAPFAFSEDSGFGDDRVFSEQSSLSPRFSFEFFSDRTISSTRSFQSTCPLPQVKSSCSSEVWRPWK